MHNNLSFNVRIEISAESDPVKYEIDKDSGLLFVDRFMPVSMMYPCNYGFVPDTLSGDGDPVDVMVYSSFPIIPGAMIKCRSIGVLLTEDEAGEDSKILALPMPKIDPMLAKIEVYSQLPEIMIKKIEHFFENYKKLESGKWVQINGWGDIKKAEEIIQQGVEAAKNL